MNFLLDTNACIALINGHPPSVRVKFQKATEKGSKVYVSSIAAFEHGVAKSMEHTMITVVFAGADLCKLFIGRWHQASNGTGPSVPSRRVTTPL